MVNSAPMLFSSGAPVAVHRVADRVLHPRVRGQDEHRREHRPDAPARCRRGARAWAAGPSRTATARGTSTPGRTPRGPPSPAGAPNTSPTKREYADQFIPNSNSCTSPVTTPTATLISSSVPKNRVRRRTPACSVRYQAVCSTATRNAEPDRHRDEQEVVDARRRELPAREVVGHGSLSPCARAGGRRRGSRWPLR